MSNGLNKLEGSFEALVEDVRETRNDMREIKNMTIEDHVKINLLDAKVHGLEHLEAELKNFIRTEQKWRVGLLITFIVLILDLILRIKGVL